MLRIAICDDNIHELSRISNLIETYRIKNDAVLSYKLFNSAIELLETIHAGDFDVLFLDILMPCTNGIQAAHEIRSFDKEIKIIFLTSSPEFATESYAVEAYYYLLKPSTEERLFPILDKIFFSSQKNDESFVIKLSSCIQRIYFENLEFIEIVNKKLLFHLIDKNVREVSGTLSYFEKILLSRPEFIKVHRSFIVNMNCINTINSNELTTYSKKVVPISRLLYSEVKDKYMKYLFVEKGIE